jgi:glutathione synthase/RimK-type ligase-like ATP-grasp enzyme
MKNSRNLIVVDDLRDWQPEWKNYPVISADEYVADDAYSSSGYRIINLCRHDHKLSMGYYTSLLAEARAHRAMPTARTLQSLMSKRIYEAQLEELNDAVRRSLSRIIQEDFSLSVYFGQNLAASHAKLAQTLFTIFPCPLFKVQFIYRDDGWEIGSLRPMGLGQVPKGHLFKVKEAVDGFLSKRWRTERDRQTGGNYDLAILHNPSEKHPPSNARALKNFIRAGEEVGLDVELITKSDLPRLLEFDALFIRETTSLDDHTYRFATKAEREGMVVIDDADSIRRCCNKVYMHELLRKNRIAMPRTEIVSAKNIDRVAADASYPLVLKIPDSAFSLGVFKVSSEVEFRAKAAELLEDSDLVLAQEFLPTDFDWRVGVLDRKPLYVCRYFMSKDHWQIYNHARKDEDRMGEFDTMAVEDAPADVIDTALRAANLIGDGLYGVDLKQRDGKCYVIEINDNPNIDAGVEDELLGHELYERVMRSFLDRIERSKQRDDVAPGSED